MWEWSKPKQNNCFASAAEKDSSLLSAYDDLLAEGTQPSAHPFRSAAEQRPGKKRRVFRKCTASLSAGSTNTNWTDLK